MDGKTVLVTGANSGIGLATALELAERGAHLVLLCRRDQAGREAVSAIAKQTKDTPELLIADLSDFASIRRAAARFQESHDRLDVLVNNAGAYFPTYRENGDGIEMGFACNHLGPYLLTRLLVGPLERSGAGRVVVLSSTAHRQGGLDLDDLGWNRRKYGAMSAYGGTKLCNVLFSTELARRLEGTGVVCNAVHPGVVATRFGSQEPSWLQRIFPLIRWFIRAPEKGAETVIFLASDPSASAVSGAYFYDCKAIEPSKMARDPALAQRLWDLSAERVGLEP